MLANTYRRQLHERALDQYGYITTRDAADLGIPPVEVRKIAQRGGLAHIARGVFRFDDIAHTGREPFMEAVLRAGDEAYLTADAVLALHDLGLVNPRRIRVGTPVRVRVALPDTIEVIKQRIEPKDLTEYEGIPATTIARALLDSRGLVMRKRLVDAAREAVRRGLMLRRDGQRVLEELETKS
jgi:predicted transcriptional regulator of viral defense system